MSIRILSFCTDTWNHEISDTPKQGVTLVNHVESILDARLNDVVTQLQESLTRDPATYQATFFTLPEFFWNTRWDNLKDEASIQALCSFYLDRMAIYVNKLVDSFPPAIYPKAGEIIFLAGTCAVLYCNEQEKIRLNVKENIYTPLNWMLGASNKRTDRSITLWPKRRTSRIDFFQQMMPAPDGSPYFVATLPEGSSIRISTSSEAVATSLNGTAISTRFANSLPGIIDFGVDICLDYGNLQNQKPANWQQRIDELEKSGCQLDFLIACGMPMDYSAPHPSGLKYLVRNDGMPTASQCQVWDLGKHILLTPVQVSQNIMQFVL
ncbi:hypothetical protein [Dryocola clanedunensis]|uniref:hypothetical protein n=1 Tax=Cedecea sulfonylureivorans TaxID=3051154 RepID=UPI0019293AF5|nr:hypothetical protein [Cedecea sulfonylureivorans]